MTSIEGFGCPLVPHFPGPRAGASRRGAPTIEAPARGRGSAERNPRARLARLAGATSDLGH